MRNAKKAIECGYAHFSSRSLGGAYSQQEHMKKSIKAKIGEKRGKTESTSHGFHKNVKTNKTSKISKPICCTLFKKTCYKRESVFIIEKLGYVPPGSLSAISAGPLSFLWKRLGENLRACTISSFCLKYLRTLFITTLQCLPSRVYFSGIEETTFFC
jgi:hypothetical protein